MDVGEDIKVRKSQSLQSQPNVNYTPDKFKFKFKFKVVHLKQWVDVWLIPP